MVSTDFRSVETTKYILYIRLLKYIAYRRCPKRRGADCDILCIPTADSESAYINITLHSYYTNIQYQKLSVLKKSYPFIPDHTMFHNQGSVKDFIVPFFHKAIQISGYFRTDAFRSGLKNMDGV